MNQITIITPPDKLYNQGIDILLIYPARDIKNDIQALLFKTEAPINLYVYEDNKNEPYINWLFDIHRMCKLCIIDFDILPHELKCIESFFISFKNTYYRTAGENILFSKISPNRFYSINDINNLRGLIGIP